MKCRSVISGLAASLAAPQVVGAQGAGVPRFVPSVDLNNGDPIYGTSFTTRNHAAMVFDIPTGVYVSPAAYRANLTDKRRGIAQFYGLRRT